jgi:molybdopterin converting factor subunit 1
MNIRLKLFAAARELAGSEEVELTLAEDACVGDIRGELVRRYPELSQMSSQLMIAVDHEYAADEAPLSPHAEVACIPPVSGG